MALVWLKEAVQDGSLVQQIGEARHVHRVEQVDLKEDLVPNIVSKERYSFDQRDMTDIY